MLVEQAQLGDPGGHRPAPAEGTSRAAGASDLVEEEALLAVDDAVVVRLADAPAPVEVERDQALLFDRAPKSLFHLSIVR